MNSVSNVELGRQYRVLRQTLSIHSVLRDRYSFKANVVGAVLLVASAVFCTTTFASDGLYLKLGLAPSDGRFILGIASVVAFCASLALLFSGWREKAVQHREAAEKWSKVLGEFQCKMDNSGNWPEAEGTFLSDLYWETDRATVRIPVARFNALKSKYLRKVEVSKMLSSHPGCPRFVCWIVVIYRSMKGTLQSRKGVKPEEVQK